jgi:hypothetical protein
VPHHQSLSLQEGQRSREADGKWGHGAREQVGGMEASASAD